MFIDSHCHLYYEPYINDIKGTLDICKKHNVKKLLSIGVNLETSKKTLNYQIYTMKFIVQSEFILMKLPI